MQSSTAIAIRALVMLIVLISVPLFAIFGKNLPEVINGLMEGRSLVLSPSAPQSTSASSPQPVQGSPFAQSVPYRASQDGRSNADSAAGNNTAPLPAAASAEGVLATQPASFQAPTEAAPIGQDAVAKRSSSPGPATAVGNEGVDRRDPLQPRFGNTLETAVVAPHGQWSTQPASRADESVAGSTSVAAATPMVGDEKFRRAEARLRALGATYYMLESWGADNSQYRFVCKMAIGGNPSMNQFFQATKADAWAAMEDVLAQVEKWRSQGPR